jgi:UDP-N-acetyl-D-glucosamine/UDP-N-acetyl-D-galactosamine dehydrogenase
MNLNNRTIAVIGLGYVGLPLAVEFGKKRPVIGFDIKADRIAELQAGHDHTLEVSHEELRQAKHLTFTSDAGSLFSARDDQAIIFIVTVPTPVDKANRPDLSPLVGASETVGRVLKARDVVIYESTVYPGCTEEVCVPILERESGLKYLAGDDTTAASAGFYCGYSPERINPGDKTHRLPDIKKVTSGSTPEVA